MFISVLFTVANIWKHPKWPSVNSSYKKMWYIYTVEYYAAEKRRIPTFCDSMDGTGEYYTKWNKPVGEIQIPYDLTYKRNQMNKIN